MVYHEINFDGLVGPTHLFSGLSIDNTASESNKGQISNPKAAALQGLAKMKLVYDLGIKQAIIPPQLRPNLEILKIRGYQGSEHEMLLKAYELEPELFKAICSTSSMWTANAATVSPAPDTQDSKTHITPANLGTHFHRSLETHATYKYLRRIFPYLSHHAPLAPAISDEGAANHSRFSLSYGDPGIELLVYGYSIEKAGLTLPQKFEPRQSLEASENIIDLHNLDLDKVVLAQQNPNAIDIGVFHNDVISTGNLNLFLYHQESFINTAEVINELNDKFHKLSGSDLNLVEVKSDEVSVEDAVSSYLFNSQIVSPSPEEMILIAPQECSENTNVKTYIDKLVSNPGNPINTVNYIDLRESMCNGGGPACLRLRVVLSEDEIKNCHQAIFFNDELYEKLTSWIEQHYRDRLEPEDILVPGFYKELMQAYQELETIIKLELN